MENKPFLRIGWRDALKGFILAVITALLTIVYQALVLDASWLTMHNLKTAAVTALLAGLSYLGKNVLTNSRGEFMTWE